MPPSTLPPAMRSSQPRVPCPDARPSAACKATDFARIDGLAVGKGTRAAWRRVERRQDGGDLRRAMSESWGSVVKELQDLKEGTGESSSAPREARPDLRVVQRRIYGRLTGGHDLLADPLFHGRLARHLQRLPQSFDFDVEDKVEGFLLHWEILQDCASSCTGRFSKSMPVRADYDGVGNSQELEESYQRLMEDLSLERRKTGDRNDSMSISSRNLFFILDNTCSVSSCPGYPSRYHVLTSSLLLQGPWEVQHNAYFAR